MAFKLSKKSDLSPKDKKQQTLWAALIILVLIISVVLYFNFWRSPSKIEIPYLDNLTYSVDSEISIDKIIEEIDFDIDFLKSNRFESLRNYKEWPLKIEGRGRNNPFMP